MSKKANNRYGAAGKRALPGPTVAAFFDQYTHQFLPGRQKIINGELVSADQNRTIRRWRAGQNANPDTVKKLLWDLGFSQDWFASWLEHEGANASKII